MKIKLKGLTLALATLSAASFADVNLYGKIAAGVENDQFQNTTVLGTGSVQDYGSYFGIRGTDSVYGETAVIWQVEQYLDVASGQAYNNTNGGGLIVPNPNGTGATGSGGGSGHVNNQLNTLASSETYIGLQGEFGRFRMGNLGNYVRDNMGTTNMFNSANGVNGLGNFSRTSKLIPTSVRYDSPTWGGFGFSALYGFNNNGLTGVSGVNSFNTFGMGLNGVYSGGIWSLGAGWSSGNLSMNLGTTIWENVGNYTTGNNGMSTCTLNGGGVGTSAVCYPNSTYSPAYANTFEIAYNDPDGIIANVGLQTASGLGWNSWPTSGGTLGIIYNPGYSAVANQLATTNNLQTQEAAVSFGYHLGPWTPKIGYAYGANMMANGDIGSVINGSAQQLANTGYQQVVAELDWNITPRTIAFVNFGQMWYGQSLANVGFSGNQIGNSGTVPNPQQAGSGTVPNAVNGNTAYQNNQSTIAMGFSHTF